MRARHWGRIVNVSSIGARIGAGSVSVAYGASKAGVTVFLKQTQGAAVEAEKYGLPAGARHVRCGQRR
jgi:NAD(P)-dependent dehydrogenase (short-subunit alcohol dehydrogenase family)